MMKPIRTRSTNNTAHNNKEKGNSFERLISKDLSNWMFGCPNVLYRQPTSGAKKDILIGDIIPIDQMPPGFNKFPFYIECKTGYPQELPTFFNFSFIEKVIKKILGELSNRKTPSFQQILLVIIRFKYQRKIVVFTNCLIPSLKWEVCLLIDNDKIFYMYDYKKLLQQDFLTCFPITCFQENV